MGAKWNNLGRPSISSQLNRLPARPSPSSGRPSWATRVQHCATNSLALSVREQVRVVNKFLAGLCKSAALEEQEEVEENDDDEEREREKDVF